MSDRASNIKLSDTNDLEINPATSDKQINWDQIAQARLYDAAWNSIESFGWALNVHDADVHNVPFNEYFHRHTGVSTTIAVASLANATSITVASSTWIVVGSVLQISDWVIEGTFPIVTIVVWNVLTLDRPLNNAFEIGDTVEVIVTNMRNEIWTLTAPISYKLIPNGNQTVHIVRFLFSMTHSTAWDLGLFWNITKLINWVTLRRYDWTTWTYWTFTHWNSNSDIKDDMYDVEFDTRSSGGGTFGTSGRWSIKIWTWAVPVLDWSKWDYIEVLIQDNIQWLISYTLKWQWHVANL
jgi:hypothetical protein